MEGDEEDEDDADKKGMRKSLWYCDHHSCDRKFSCQSPYHPAFPSSNHCWGKIRL